MLSFSLTASARQTPYLGIRGAPSGRALLQNFAPNSMPTVRGFPGVP